MSLLTFFFTKSCIFSAEGGPLHQGDIEDYHGRPHLMCPWHGYMFDAQTGKNEIGLMVMLYPYLDL